MENVAPTELVERQLIDPATAPLRAALERDIISRKLLYEHSDQLVEGLPPDISTEQVHGIGGRGIADADVIHRAAHEPDVEVGCRSCNFLAHSLGIVCRLERREQNCYLPCEFVVCIVEYRLKAGGIGLGCSDDLLVSTGKERKVPRYPYKIALLCTDL